MQPLKQLSPDPSQVLCKALFRAADLLSLRQEEIGRVIGLNRTSVSRLSKKGELDPKSKQGELALVLIRVARALSALAGGDAQFIQKFMRSPNSLTGAIPAEQVQTVSGLWDVLRVVDALRGKI